MIEIVVPHQIAKKEIPPLEQADAKKLFAKLKAKPDLATSLSAKGLPERTSLFKVYATTAHGARRLLFFYRRPVPSTSTASASLGRPNPLSRRLRHLQNAGFFCSIATKTMWSERT